MKALLSMLFLNYFLLLNPTPVDPPSGAPLSGKWVVSHHFGTVMPTSDEDQILHAIDFDVNYGTQVIATAAGVVTELGEDEDHYYIVLNHNGDFQTIYGQLSKIKVNEGQQIEKGDVIALTGGIAKSGLRYGIKHHGKYIDPALHLSR